MMGPNMFQLDAKYYQQCGMMTHLQLAGACVLKVCVVVGIEYYFFCVTKKKNPRTKFKNNLNTIITDERV